MHTRHIGGPHGTPVGAVGLGCMGMSYAYDPAGRDDATSTAVLHRALDLGANLVESRRPVSARPGRLRRRGEPAAPRRPARAHPRRRRRQPALARSSAPVFKWERELHRAGPRRGLRGPLAVPRLSRYAGMSERSFLRRFVDETGATPLRSMGLARGLLEATDRSVDVVARASGLGSAAHLWLHFRRTLSTTPTAYRRSFSREPSPPTADESAVAERTPGPWKRGSRNAPPGVIRITGWFPHPFT
ncbi:helix-turn-helix domain-containing protein [Streptomyces sp. JW3]|uniref:helix-turn-helix domain-containing protein n=1 Tax=Streptomyces sp. JW3 TaxID=3456955 RepID=UPI003FA49187